VGAAAAAATAGGVGMGLFSYNRGNYQFDQKNHYTRFTAGLNMAIAQTGIYKQDITQLTALTVTRQDCYHGIAAMGLTILTAIYCPGRVGLHTPPPPGWLMGLGFVNIAGAYMFLGLTLWLAMHASMRADTAATHMLTRFVRLPIPSQGMLDKARKFLSSYEEQPLKEVFRVPFTRHQNESKYNQGDYNEDVDVDDAAQGRSRHGYDVPAWYRKEKEVDNVNTIDSIGSMMPLDARGTAPEHFEAYRELQMEWFPYDVYARLSIFLAFMHLTHCWAYLQIGHQLTENRALFACAIVILPMFVLQQVILTLDIIPDGLPIHRLGPFGLWFAYIAAAIEYKRWYTPEAQFVGFVLVYIAYAIHIIYTLQLLRICAPSETPPVVADSPGASWWPGEWRLPSAFQHAIWMVAPPKQLQDGEHDIAGELRDMQRGGPSTLGAGATQAERRKDVHRALGKQGESPAWFNVKVGLISLVIAWVFLTFGFTIEVINQGTAHPSLLNAHGMPNNARDPRYRPAKPGSHEHTEVGTGGVAAGPAKGVHMEAVHRRLSGVDLASGFAPQTATRQEIANKLRDLMPYLQELARTGSAPVPAAEAPSTELSHMAVQWPPLFEPQHLACSEASPVALALSRHGRGALIAASTAGHGPVDAKHLTLEGVATHGPLVATSWDSEGLLLVTASGVTLECPGANAADGRWHCAPLPGAKLPIAMGGKPFAGTVAVTRVARQVAGATLALRAAVLFPGEASVTIFSRAGHAAAAWLPTGEVRVAAPAVAASFAAEGEHLLLTSADGSTAQMLMTDGSVSEAIAGANSGHAWKGACRLPSGSLARLALSTSASGVSEAKFILG